MSQDDKNEEFMFPRLFGWTVMNARGYTTGRARGHRWKRPPIFITEPLLTQVPDLEGAYFFHLSLLTAIRVGCQSPIFSPCPRVMPDMTDSLLGLPDSQICTPHPEIVTNAPSPSEGPSLAPQRQQPPSHDLIFWLLLLDSN